MTIFGAYSRYYNLLYQEKDYVAESVYVQGLFERHAPTAKSVLDLGCGTGGHAFILAQQGYEVSAVDRSAEMLAIADARRSSATSPQTAISFFQGDIRTIRLGKTFDTVISLFHVVSYQTTNADLCATFATVRKHLSPGGIFIFDCWYGPAVLTDRPVRRVKLLENKETTVTRIATPEMFPNDNLVSVHYQLRVEDKATGVVEDLCESHDMRYLFRPEIEIFLEQAGMQILEATEWLTGREPGFDTWGVSFVVQG